MNALELRVPPVLQLLIAGLLMTLTARTFPLVVVFPGQWLVACGFIAAGSLIALAGVVEFRRAGTTVDPRRPHVTACIVTSGIYRYTRNPMYLGFVSALGGLAIGLGNPFAGLVVPFYVAYLQRFQIHPEERLLTDRFGASFTEYSQRTRRWL